MACKEAKGRVFEQALSPLWFHSILTVTLRAWLNDLQDQNFSEFEENPCGLPTVVTLNVK